MINFLNPTQFGDWTKVGLSLGADVGPFVFAVGMAFDLDTMTRRADADTVADETRICFEEIEATLKEAGCTLRDIAKTTCYVSDDAYREEFRAAYDDLFAPGPYPVRTTFVVGIAGNCRVEIEALAVRAGGASA